MCVSSIRPYFRFSFLQSVEAASSTIQLLVGYTERTQRWRQQCTAWWCAHRQSRVTAWLANWISYILSYSQLTTDPNWFPIVCSVWIRCCYARFIDFLPTQITIYISSIIHFTTTDKKYRRHNNQFAVTSDFLLFFSFWTHWITTETHPAWCGEIGFTRANGSNARR